MPRRRSSKNTARLKKRQWVPLRINEKILNRINETNSSTSGARSTTKTPKAQPAPKKQGQSVVVGGPRVGAATTNNPGRGKKRPRDEDEDSEKVSATNRIGQQNANFSSNKRVRVEDLMQGQQGKLLHDPATYPQTTRLGHPEQQAFGKQRQQIFNKYVKSDTSKTTQIDSESCALPVPVPSGKDLRVAVVNESANHVRGRPSCVGVDQTSQSPRSELQKHECALASLCRASNPVSPQNTYNPTKKSLASAPMEVLVDIFQYTDPISANMLALTCRKLAGASTLANVQCPRDQRGERLKLLLQLRDSVPDHLRLCCKCEKYLPINGRRYRVGDYIWNRNKDRDKDLPAPPAYGLIHTRRARIRAAIEHKRAIKARREAHLKRGKAKYSKWKDEDWILLKIGGRKLRMMNQDRGIEYQKGEEKGEIRAWCPQCAYNKEFRNIKF